MTQTDANNLATMQNDQQKYDDAIVKGLEILSGGGSKADSARSIFEILDGEDREIIIRAFIQGATLTEKGAPTYFYNIDRKALRNRKSTTVQPQGFVHKKAKPLAKKSDV